MASSELIQQCDDFLKGKRCTLWGENFNVIYRSDRAKAAEWLANQYEELQEFLIAGKLSATGEAPPRSE